jgi:tRNA-2-methylthio-N6-dimethylallyladenosine synthase
MNKYDSELFSGFLRARGYQIVDEFNDADFVLLNTCSVRKKAEDKVFSKLGILLKKKEKDPHLIIGICGCMAARLKDELFKRFPQLNFLIGPNDFNNFIENFDKIQSGEKFISITESMENPPCFPEILRKDRFKAWVPVAYGCDNFCSYCIVPYVRGRLRCRSPEEIFQEVSNLAKSSYREVTLLGQDVASYEYITNNGKNVRFSDLLKKLCKLNNLLRIRFETSHPKSVDKELIETIKEEEKICNHIHLPLQGGSDKLLKAMNRGYTLQYYKDLVYLIRSEIPECSITSDIIVGYPGEDEEDFLSLLDTMEELRFDSAFMFKFSPREGTAAASMGGQLSEQIKSERLNKVIELQNKITLEKNSQLIGNLVEVLVDSINPKHKDEMMGRTQTNKIVCFPGGEDLLGRLVKVEIKEAYVGSLRGIIKEVT